MIDQIADYPKYFSPIFHDGGRDGQYNLPTV